MKSNRILKSKEDFIFLKNSDKIPPLIIDTRVRGKPGVNTQTETGVITHSETESNTTFSQQMTI